MWPFLNAIKKMDKEEFIEKACQELYNLTGSDSEVEIFRKVLERNAKGLKIIKGQTPKEAVDLWTM